MLLKGHSEKSLAQFPLDFNLLHHVNKRKMVKIQFNFQGKKNDVLAWCVLLKWRGSSAKTLLMWRLFVHRFP